MTGNLIGVRSGSIISRKDKLKKDPRFDWVAKLPKFLNLPHWLIYFSNLGPTMEELRFGNQYVFQDLDDANMVYMAILLSVGREARGIGLGTELMKRGYQVAKKVKLRYFLNRHYFMAPCLYE